MLPIFIIFVVAVLVLIYQLKVRPLLTKPKRKPKQKATKYIKQPHIREDSNESVRSKATEEPKQ